MDALSIQIMLPVFIVLTVFAGIFIQRRQVKSELKEIAHEVGHDALAMRGAPKNGGYMALYNDFLIYRKNGFAQPTRIPYTAVTRLGVDELHLLPQSQAMVCIEYRDGNNESRLAQMVVLHRDGFVPILRQKTGVATH